MKLPQLENAQHYVGLYLIDFPDDQAGNDHCAVGYTAEEVASLLDSEQFSQAKVYKIYRAYPDGRMELQGITHDRFMLESGMIFHCLDDATGQKDFQKLTQWASENAPPCRVKLERTQTTENQNLIAMIYPAEYEHEIGLWMQNSKFQGQGPIDAGVSQVNHYYQSARETLEKEQLWPKHSLQARDREELLASVSQPIQRQIV